MEEEKKEEEFNIEEIKEYLDAFLGKSKEEALAKAVEHLADADKILLFSDILSFEIPKLSTLKVIAHRYGLEWLNQYLTFNLLLRVSRERLGRKEIVSMVSSKTIPLTERFRRFLGKGKEEESKDFAIP
jgi:hypothetical protein